MSFIIKAKNIGCVYNGRDESNSVGIFVDEINIPAVGITTIVGPSGSGKSTLLTLLSGIREPNKLSEDSLLQLHPGNKKELVNLIKSNLDAAGKIGFVFQDANLIKEVSAYSNATIVKNLIVDTPSDLDVEVLIDQFGLADVIYNQAGTLSGGQAQRVAIIRALCFGPDVLICDEPTSSLDQKTGENLLKELATWANENKKAVLWVTHNLDQAAKFSDYLIKVENGKILECPDGKPINLKELNKSEREKIISGEMSGSLDQPDRHPASSDPVKSTNAADERSRLAFLFHLVFQYFFLPRVHQRKEARHFELLISNFWRPFSRNSTLWLLSISSLILFLLVKGVLLTDRYFDNELSKPELTHFTFTGAGDFKLTPPEFTSLNKKLKNVLGSEDKDIIFSRRENFFNNVALPIDGGCDAYGEFSAKSSKAPLLVFDLDEPLFKEFTQNASSSVASKYSTLWAAAPLKDLYFDGREPKQLCLDVYGYFELLEVVWVKEIPSGADRSFFLGISEQAYQSASENSDQNLAKLSYDYAAAYFEPNKSTELLCLFDNSNDKCTSNTIRSPRDFAINKDVFEQVRSFSFLSTLAVGAIGFIIFAFCITIGISTAFAVNSEVKSQEKSLALLRAFGISSGLLLLKYQIRTLVVTLYASLLYALSLLIIMALTAYSGVTQEIEAYTGLEFRLEPMDYLVPVLLIFILAELICAAVVGLWLRQNRFTAEKLQGM